MLTARLIHDAYLLMMLSAANQQLPLLLLLLPHQVPDRVMKTSSHFVEAAARRPDDAQVQEALAELLSRTDPVGE